VKQGGRAAAESLVRAPYGRAVPDAATVDFIDCLNGAFTLRKNSELERGLHDRINCAEIVGP